MKIEVFVVRVDNYLPELCDITLPRIEAYAKRIGAKFTLISTRKYPEFPPTYEKMQIHELGKDNDYNILLDADIVLGDDFEDITKNVPLNGVGFWHEYKASSLFAIDEYFFRDQRGVGVATNMLVVPRSCHDIFTPLEFGAEEASKRTSRWFIVDEYCVSRNLAKFGLKYKSCLTREDNFLHLNVTTDNLKDEVKRAELWLTHQNKNWPWK
jgi:hypothetical protein